MTIPIDAIYGSEHLLVVSVPGSWRAEQRLQQNAQM
jgi:hypothetical protein